MKVLAVGAHFDDIELGCGGALAKWASEGHGIHFLVTTDSGYSDASGRVVRSPAAAIAEGKASAQLIGAEVHGLGFPTFGMPSDGDLNVAILKVFGQVKPDIVLTHWSADCHLDHKRVHQAVMHCARGINKVLGFRSNWAESSVTFDGNFFVDVSDFYNKKLEMIECHQSENERTQGRWVDWVSCQMRVDGLKAGTQFAESFELLRWMI